jgi:acetyl-CoA carboxylase, biotin carboxylase subunit
MPGLPDRVLVANRGEIAVRVIRACRDLGIEAVAVYSEADADALHVALADEAVEIGKAQAKASYLRPEAVVEAAVSTGCGVLHPGYGFLAEDPRLPTACAEAGIAFAGPPADVMAAVGDKVTARGAAERAGVPVVPGTGRLEDPDAALAAAEEIGFPVLLKASAGGGGRGIRRVDDPGELTAAFSRASAEAEAAFGDGGLFVEKCIVRPRHVEVQVLADTHGNVIHLYERDCSVQRRKQKLIEEAPAPNLDASIREGLCDAALALAREVGYVNAGTAEFIVDPVGGTFHFLEMNARIQVEHGVTELLCGVDLVCEQLRVAAGLPLSVAQEDVVARGCAIELRINAEDPEQKFMPSPGEITGWHAPSGPGVRVDAGVEAGRKVVPFYDSMVAKVMVWGTDREQALARARRALDELTVEGIKTTRDLQRSLLDWEEFTEGRATTESLESYLGAAA